MLNKNLQGLMETTIPSVDKPTSSATTPPNTGLSLHQDSSSTIRRVQKALQQSNQSQLRPNQLQQTTQMNNKEGMNQNDILLTSPVYQTTDDVYYEPTKVVNPDEPVTYPTLHLSLQLVYNEIKSELTDEMKYYQTTLQQSTPIETTNMKSRFFHDEPVEYDIADLETK